jgi:hypothetical protein
MPASRKRNNSMTFFKLDEYLSNFLHAALAISFGIPLFGIALHVAKHLV